MASKGSLRNSIRDGDALKKEVDAFAVECQGVIEDMGLTDRKQRMQKLLQRSKDLIKKATKSEQTVSKHTKGKEPTPISRFDEVKADEVKRLRTLKSRLEKLQDSLIPDEIEEEYLRQAVNEGTPSSSKKVSVGPGANSTIEDEESGEEEDDQEKDDKSPSPKPESKPKRLSLFRRSSKRSKDAASKPKEMDNSMTVETKKEKKDREKQEKLLEKELREREKQDKREKDKLEKELKENEKEQKQKETKEGGVKGKPGQADGTLEGISEQSELEDEDEEEEDYDEDEDEDDEMENEDIQDKPSKLPQKQNVKSSSGSKQMTSKTSMEKKGGGGGWRLFQRKPSDRKETTSGGGGDTKEKGTPVKEKMSKTDEKKSKEALKPAAAEQDEDDDEEDDDDEEEYEDEEEVDEEYVSDEEDVSGDEEEVEEEEDEEEDEDEEDDDEDDEDEYEEDSQYELGGTGGSNVSDGVFQPPDEGMERYEAVCDFDQEQAEDLGFRRGDIVTVINTREDGWWMAEDEEGNRGLVPSTYLKLKKDYSDYRDVQSPQHGDGQGARTKSGVELWKGLKKAMTETSVTDVLTAMGAIPSGFRPSMTCKLLKEDQYTLCHILKPRLSPSSLAFKDLFWNPQENQIRARSVRVQKMISISMIKNMPQVGAGLETKNRHIRVAVFDGEKILSNIHTVQATHIESDPKTWKFSPKMAGMLPSLLDGDCFVRTTHTEENIGLLFEICLSYLRTKTGEKGEFSCGWVHLPLFDETSGAPVVNKVYDLPIKGGTPYEQDVQVDPSISRKVSTSKFRTMMTANKMPRLVVKLVTPTKEQKAELDTLPDTVVSSACYIPALSFYRKLLADALLTDRIDLQNTDLIHSPVLASFPKATMYPDIMDALRSCWAEKKRTMKKSDKRDLGQMKKLFSDACMESVYPLLQSPTLPLYKFGDTENDQERWEEISSLMKSNQTSGILHYLLQPGVTRHAS